MSDLSIEALVAQLKSANPDERANAAFILGRNRDNRIVRPLIVAITDDEPAVRIRVIEALGTRHETEVVPPLMAILRNDHNPDVRRTAARSLGYIADDRAVETLSKVLAADEDESVRAQAADALGSIGAASATGALVAALINDTEHHVRSFTQQALVAIGGLAVVNGLTNKLQPEAQITTLIDVLETLGQLRDNRAQAAIAALQTHPDEDVAATAQWALSSLRP